MADSPKPSRRDRAYAHVQHGQGCTNDAAYGGAPASSGGWSDGAICHDGILSDDAGHNCADGMYERVYGSGGSSSTSTSTSAPRQRSSHPVAAATTPTCPECPARSPRASPTPSRRTARPPRTSTGSFPPRASTCQATPSRSRSKRSRRCTRLTGHRSPGRRTTAAEQVLHATTVAAAAVAAATRFIPLRRAAQKTFSGPG